MELGLKTLVLVTQGNVISTPVYLAKSDCEGKLLLDVFLCLETLQSVIVSKSSLRDCLLAHYRYIGHA